MNKLSALTPKAKQVEHGRGLGTYLMAACVRALTSSNAMEACVAEICASLINAGVELVRLEAGAKDVAWVVPVDVVNAEVLAELRSLSRSGLERVLVIVCGSEDAAPERDGLWRLLESGASDVVHFRADTKQPLEIAERLRRWQEIDELLETPLVRNNLVGKSRAWVSMLREVIEVARFGESAVLVTGESGTGKELIARLVHTLDARADKKDLVVVDCTTLARELAGSELFGHERGAYTGASGARDGAVALANGGTLFLDEVGELPLPLQAQLLRLVQERSYKRVGGNAWQSSQFRLVSATNRDLSADVDAGCFRGDLYYRLNTWMCRTPPLRERTEDILPLVEHFVRGFFPGGRELHDSVRQYLLQREYPGNVRELRQVVQRICARHVGDGPLTVGDIALHERPRLPFTCDWQERWLEPGIRRALDQGVGMREIGRAAEDLAVQIAVGDEQGNLQRAARRLGVTDRALQQRRAERRR